MKYVLFVLGLLLLLVGSYSVYIGSHIIEIERGWTSVIAGTTAVVGGLLTLGLAWIIRTLEQLRVAIQAHEMMNMAVRSAIPTLLHSSDSFASATNLPAMAWPPHTETAHGLATAKKESIEPAPSHAELQREAETFEERAYDFPSAEIDENLQPQAEAEPAATERVKLSPSIKSLWHRVAKETDASKPAAQPAIEQEPTRETITPHIAPVSEPIAVAETQTEAQQTAEISGDWLDHALADLDAAIAQAPHPADAGIAEPPAPAVVETHIAVQLDETVHMGETPPLAPEEPAPEEPPAMAGEEPAVIGRYEADGTTYIMFADGSIEAQSERGVSRFKSMADLKAYFETQDAS